MRWLERSGRCERTTNLSRRALGEKRPEIEEVRQTHYGEGKVESADYLV